ncbi:MAG: hydroxyneurosporene methyltransferase [Chloroflexi bacterium]|nr:hydroxyneurosporene methyltransferase [Chloroflexota bacterium]
MSADVTGRVSDLIFGRWRSQILFTGAQLAVFDQLSATETRSSEMTAAMIDADPPLTYRLLRALGSLGLLTEDEDHGFRLTDAGALLRADHPRSLRSMALLEEGPEHYALWKHLPSLIRDGKQNGFVREFGMMGFEYAKANPGYGDVFNQAMTSYSAVESQLVVEALAESDLSDVRTWCDVAGGYGHLLCSLLVAYPELTGILLDLPDVTDDREHQIAPQMGLSDRCHAVGGDMFTEAPAADAYSLKHILHDWNDQECVAILKNIRAAATGPGRVFVIEYIVPGPREPHFAKLFDIHMLCWGTGRERTESEYAQLLEAAGFRHIRSWYPANHLMGVIEGVAA